MLGSLLESTKRTYSTMSAGSGRSPRDILMYGMRMSAIDLVMLVSIKATGGCLKFMHTKNAYVPSSVP